MEGFDKNLTGEALKEFMRKKSRRHGYGEPILEEHPGHAPTGLPKGKGLTETVVEILDEELDRRRQKVAEVTRPEPMAMDDLPSAPEAVEFSKDGPTFEASNFNAADEIPECVQDGTENGYHLIEFSHHTRTN